MLINLWERKWQRLPTQRELQGLIEQQIREEVLYREALAMGLDKKGLNGAECLASYVIGATAAFWVIERT